MLRDATQTQASAFAAGTYNNYLNQWVNFLQFCVNLRLEVLPATPTTLICYAQAMSRRLKAHGSLLSFMSGVKKLHWFLGLTTSVFENFQLKLTLSGLRRLNQHVPKQALSITPVILEKIYSVMDFTREEDVVFWCACVFAFFLLFRKSNLVLDKPWSFDGDKQLRRSDLIFTGRHIVVGIRWAKNHQFSREL